MAGWRIFLDRHWRQRLDRLAGHVAQLKDVTMNELKVHAPAGERLIIMTRIFEAPRALVWKAMTQREHIGLWWGASSFTEKVVVAKYDFRPGGEWRFESHGKDGKVYVFKGRILEIEEPRRVVQTFGMEGMFEDKLIVEDLSLEELPDGRTLYHQLSTYDSVEDRDGMVASGMEDGARQTLDELERVIAGLKAQQAVQQQQ